jgi:4-amino-4-deoxy-L-arabinose transferase-like glycosyltransferase
MERTMRVSKGDVVEGRTGSVWVGEAIALSLILIVAAVLRLWSLAENGFGNTYYAAAVRSMSLSLHNAFFGSFDPAGFLSVDKPPLALWIQTLFVRVVGYGPIALHLPQALVGVASVALLWRLVRAPFGPAAGLTAAFTLALTPISVAVDRSNNLDSWLVVFLLLAAGAFLSSGRTEGRSYHLWGALFVGLGFNVKMLAAFLLLPTLYAVSLLGMTVPWPRRLGIAAATGVLLAVSLPWMLLVDATPPSHRPFIGGSQTNSALELAFGYNGAARLFGGQGQIQGLRSDNAPADQAGANPMFGGEPGPRRLLEPALAGQALWLLPLALIGIAGAALRFPWRLPLSPQAQQVLLWGGWLLSYAAVFSSARGTFHPYYLSLLAPPLAALIGIAMKVSVDAVKVPGRRAAVLVGLTVGMLMSSVLWQAALLRDHPAMATGLTLTALFGALLASATLLLACLIRPPGTTWQASALVGAAGLLAAPTVWCVETVRQPESFVMPLAGPPDARRQQMARETRIVYERADPRLIAFLRDHRRGERFLLAAETAYTASPLIIRTSEPVIAIGGFLGIDPAVSLDQFRQMVRQRQLRYVLLVSDEAWEGGGPNAAIFQWVQDNGTLVDPTLWRSPGNASLLYGHLYDLSSDRKP